MRKKPVLKREPREKHTRMRNSAAAIAVPTTKETTVREEPVEEPEPIVKKRTRKAQAPKAETPAVVDENTENNE